MMRRSWSISPWFGIPKPAPVHLGLAVSPVAVENPFLHFKTTYREVVLVVSF